MRKEVFLGLAGLLFAALFIASCVPVAKYYVCPDNRKVLNPEQCTPINQETNQAVVPENVTGPVQEVAVVKGISPEAQALFDKFAKVNYLQFVYVNSAAQVPENVYYASKDRMKVVLKTKVKFSGTELYDTVYLDLVNKTAVAYCEDKFVCNDLNTPMNIDYSQYIIETPFDWMAKIAKASLTGRSKSLESRNAIEVSIEADGQQGLMYVDSFFSAPLSVTLGSTTYDYKNMVINEAGPTDLAHQKLGP